MNDDLGPRILCPIWPDVAHKLGIGRTTVYELIAAGDLPAVKIGRRTLVPQAAIDAYVGGLVKIGASTM